MDLIAHTKHLLENYQRCFEKPLIERGENEVKQLMTAPFAVLSHGTQDDPIFNYGNQTAQALFEMDWTTLTALPSRYSAEPMHRDERQQVLNEVTSKGYSENYRGIRISASGRLFYIDSARIWTLRNEYDAYIGQAAMFSIGNGSECGCRTSRALSSSRSQKIDCLSMNDQTVSSEKPF